MLMLLMGKVLDKGYISDSCLEESFLLHLTVDKNRYGEFSRVLS